MVRQTAVQIRTAKLIAYYQAIPNEFELLKGILISSFPFEGEERKRIDAMFDMGMIARRMDEITDALRAEVQARIELSAAQIKNGTGFSRDARFVQVDEKRHSV